MRSLGADEEGYPVLDTVLEHYASDTVLEHYASLVNSDVTTRIPRFSESSEYLHGPLFHLDLKGPNLTSKHLDNVQDKLLELGIQNNVAICAGVLKDGEVGPGFYILKHLARRIHLEQVCALFSRSRRKGLETRHSS